MQKQPNQKAHLVGHLHSTADIGTCLYYTGIDPFTMKSVTVARGKRDRKMQRALMQFFKPWAKTQLILPIPCHISCLLVMDSVAPVL